MGPVEGNAERQGHEAVKGPQVVGPQERLTAEVNVRREEPEHRVEDGHLQQTWQTSRHRVDPGLAVELHGFLLALHGVFFVPFVDFVELGPEHPHLRRAHVVLPCDWEERTLDDQRQNEDDQPHVADVVGHKVVHWEDDVSVDPTKDPPPVVDDAPDLLETSGLQRRQVVGPKVEVQLLAVVRQLGRVAHHVRCVVFGQNVGDFGARGERFRAADQGREVVLLERHPAQARFQHFVVFLSVAQVIALFAELQVVDGAVLTLPLQAFLVPLSKRVPCEEPLAFGEAVDADEIDVGFDLVALQFVNDADGVVVAQVRFQHKLGGAF